MRIDEQGSHLVETFANEDGDTQPLGNWGLSGETVSIQLDDKAPRFLTLISGPENEDVGVHVFYLAPYGLDSKLSEVWFRMDAPDPNDDYEPPSRY